MSKRRIAVVASSIHPVRQGHLLSWYQDLLESGNVFTYKLFLGSEDKNIPAANNYKINSKLEKIKYFLRGTKPHQLQPLLDFKPDVIHLLTSNVFPYIKTIKEEGIPLIVSFRGYDLNVFPSLSKKNLELTREIFDYANVLHFVSEGLMRTAIDLGAEPKKCKIIRRSARIEGDLSGIAKKNQSEVPVIASVGRLVWEKGYIYALEAVAILKQKGLKFHYIIGGSGPDENMIRFQVNRLGISSYMTLLGELKKREVYELLQKADIYLQTSVTEAMPNTIIEASYFSLPVVSSRIGGIPEVVEDGVTGFLSEACNPEGYANSLEKLILDKDLREKMGSAGRKRIEEFYNRSAEINEWNKIYAGILND